ncbi:unnamed protein product [Danaus chrysippus]|uniref:(African queen) hypothetical protein n=1 Tax=Danaus chrysippus TaxID=151541 RepID=A0A8J2W183_9NEOP|nr:unnamed protein product [Danaus chrysippus]
MALTNILDLRLKGGGLRGEVARVQACAGSSGWLTALTYAPLCRPYPSPTVGAIRRIRTGNQKTCDMSEL